MGIKGSKSINVESAKSIELKAPQGFDYRNIATFLGDKNFLKEAGARKNKKRKMLSTLLTGPQGLIDPATVQRKTLLGE